LHQLVQDAEGLVSFDTTLTESLVGGIFPIVHLQAVRALMDAAPSLVENQTAALHQGIVWLLRQFRSLLQLVLCERADTDNEARRLWTILDLACTTLIGLLVDGVLFHGFFSIDHWEWTDWLTHHGASPETLASAPVRGTYDYIFGFEGGDTSKRCVAAGTCVQGLMRLSLTAKGAIFWEMQAGMGDTVFTPLYQVLKKRGVKFQFFHRVHSLQVERTPAGDFSDSIDQIVLGRQATIKPGAADGEYQPLININDLACWPSTPLYDQLVEGDALRAGQIDLESPWADWQETEVVLHKGSEFDEVVLGISLGALRAICAELITARPAWREMVDRVKSVSTQALQLWLAPDARGLGWEYPTTILTAYDPPLDHPQPMDTWGDLSHLIGREDWPIAAMPRSIAYFCGPMTDDPAGIPPPTDHGFPARQLARVREASVRFLEEYSSTIWPTASGPNGFCWELLVAPGNQNTGPERIDSQYLRANIAPSERYVISVPGSTQFRLRADGSGFKNLYLAGDWVYTPINAGCVEAAVMGGFAASRAIGGTPQTIIGEIYLGPNGESDGPAGSP
jgi:uncharacterized protein with NAD-binding domain and iron-sulfur cluster